MVVFTHRLKSRLASCSLIVAIMICTPWAKAEVLFEGYSKVLLSGEHVGYVVQRYEFDSKKKEFTTTSYLRTNAAGGNITESLKARSSASLRPISYQYTGLNGGVGKTIDATVNGDDLTAVIRENGKLQTTKKKLPKGAFLSSFLAYLMLQGKEGIKPGAKYGYQAVAEEDASPYTGEAYVEKEEIVGGITTFKVLNTFKGTQFVSNVTHKGEIIATRSPVQKIETILASNMQEAVGGMPFNANSVKMLFGSIPKGKENAIARKTNSLAASAEKQKILNATPAPTGDNPKTEGVPAGQGIVIKGAPTKSDIPSHKPTSKK